MITPTEGLVALARWIQELHYNDIRRAESFQEVKVRIGRKKKSRMRAVRVAPDLCLSRHRMFYKILGDKAVLMPLHLVAEQYRVADIKDGYRRAVREQEIERKKIREEA